MHRSISVAPAKNSGSNQRLEFLGDRVLNLIIAELLYKTYPEEEEGALARRYAGLVSRTAIARVARTIDLGAYLELPEGEGNEPLRSLDSTLEDACEALIGALFLDGGLEAAKRFVLHYWTSLQQESLTPPKDAKTALQEWGQAQGFGLPVYVQKDRQGPAHAPRFVIEVRLSGGHSAQGEGATKKAAEQIAAMNLLEKISAV